MKPARILSIAGSDSGGGAGIQADIKTVTMLGGFAMTAITAITAQNTRGVTGVSLISPDMVTAQIDAVADDIGIDAVKIGMLGSAEIAERVAEWLEGRKGAFPIVFDPVMFATSGAVLADAATIAAFERLMRVGTVVTPNLPELAALAGEGDPETRARELAMRHKVAVLAKGGHGTGEILVDRLLMPDGTVRCWESTRIETLHSHGTGCTLASAIACGLGQGMTLDDAIARARDYVRAALECAPGLGDGHGPVGHGLGSTGWGLAKNAPPAAKLLTGA